MRCADPIGAGAMPVVKYSVASRTEIGERHADLHRRSAALARDRHEAGYALRDEIESALLSIGPVLSVPRDRRVHDSRVDRGDRFVAEAELLENAGTEVLDEDVRLARQPFERF